MQKKLIVPLSLCLALALGTGAVSAVAAENTNFQQPITSAGEALITDMIFQQDGSTIRQSSDNGETWEAYTPIKEPVFFSYDEYAVWIATEIENIQKLVEAGQWTQEKADEVIASYSATLNEIATGLKVNKRSSYDEEQILFSMSDTAQEESYQTVVYDGKTFENFGPFETKNELFTALKEYTEKQIALGSMTSEEADELLKKYN